MILIGLGANLPSSGRSAYETILAAFDSFTNKNINIVAKSSIWRTAPVPVMDQPDYYNAVIAVETDLRPKPLLDVLQDIESLFGRVRTTLNAPRVLDLDLLAYNNVVNDDPLLTLPHPRMHQRAFVLLPMKEIAPTWRHPVTRTLLEVYIHMLPRDQIAVRCGSNVAEHRDAA